MLCTFTKSTLYFQIYFQRYFYGITYTWRRDVKQKGIDGLYGNYRVFQAYMLSRPVPAKLQQFCFSCSAPNEHPLLCLSMFSLQKERVNSLNYELSQIRFRRKMLLRHTSERRKKKRTHFTSKRLHAYSVYFGPFTLAIFEVISWRSNFACLKQRGVNGDIALKFPPKSPLKKQLV